MNKSDIRTDKKLSRQLYLFIQRLLISDTISAPTVSGVSLGMTAPCKVLHPAATSYVNVQYNYKLHEQMKSSHIGIQTWKAQN